jgi:hypothetical protein
MYFIFVRFCEFQKLFKKIKAKESLKEATSSAGHTARNEYARSQVEI